MDTPVIETERLWLRPFRKNDVEAVFYGWENDPEVAKYMFWCSHQELEKTKEWIAFELQQIPSDLWYRWAVVEKERQALIGTGLIYYEEEFQSFEIGYNFSRQCWGRGYATETMRAVLAFAEKELGIRKLVGRYAKDNTASGNVMKKLGFVDCKDIVYEANGGKTAFEGSLCELILT